MAGVGAIRPEPQERQAFGVTRDDRGEPVVAVLVHDDRLGVVAPLGEQGVEELRRPRPCARASP